MPNRPPRAAPTREHRPPTEEHTRPSRAVLLSAFPAQKFVPLPSSDEVVGYDWLADAGIPDEEVSARHLRFHRTRGRLEVEDVGSTNGTFVDARRLAPGERATLEDGAVLRLGGTLFVHREAYTGPDDPARPLGALVGPWGLGALREDLDTLLGHHVRNLLVLGESGTGKQLLAEEIARRLGRRGHFGELNVAAIPADRLEAELFGWEHGAFTGAERKHLGIIRHCEKGTVFLDEIGELPLLLQPKLLRLIENHEVQPLGALERIKVDVVLVAATNRKLDEEVRADRFRKDLHARFYPRFTLPRLADRPEDLFAILMALLQRSRGVQVLGEVQVEAIELLMLHDWQANVRDLDRLAQAIDPRVGLKRSVVRRVLEIEVPAAPAAAPQLTREAIAAALAKHEGNRSRAAKELGVSRAKLLRAMKKEGVG
jgi:MoxR-like ATPase